NPRGKTTETQYDAAWRVTKSIDPSGDEYANAYDGNGNRTSWSILEKDGLSNVTHQFEATFDVGNRITARREIDRTNSTHVLQTAYGWDSHSNLVWMVDALGNPTRFTYDGANRMTKKEVAITVGSPITTFTSA